MKVLLLVIILSLSHPIFAQENIVSFSYGDIRGLIPKDEDSSFSFHEIFTAIKISNMQTTNVGLIFSDKNTSNSFLIELSSQQRQDLLQAIAKYKDWNGKAIKEKYEIEKEITNIDSTSIYWKKDSDQYGFFNYNMSLRLIFFSQNEKRHQLVLVLPFLEIKQEKVSIQPPTIYIEYDEVLKLENLFSEKAITQAITREKRKEELFR
ncbi:MAG: hypothetical protein ACRCY4_02875 [Brevinema sp.]